MTSDPYLAVCKLSADSYISGRGRGSVHIIMHFVLDFSILLYILHVVF
jgi:hypothetical protein